MQTQNRYGKLQQKDLSSLANLKAWLKDNISIYKFEKDVGDQDLLIYIDYIENKVREYQGEIDKRFWLKLIRQLRERMRVIKETEG